MPKLLLAGLYTLLFSSIAHALYLPGVAPNDYERDSNVPLFVNSLTPMSIQQKSLISYNHYDERFHFCQPQGGPRTQPESLGSVLFGDRILTSPFKLSLRKMFTMKSCVHRMLFLPKMWNSLTVHLMNML
ncbi:unnamed protein product [Rhizopus stolonifer]